MPVLEAGERPALDVSIESVGMTLGLAWAVPSVAFAVPGLLLIMILVTQALGGAMWLPVVRRRIGSWGPHRGRARPA